MEEIQSVDGIEVIGPVSEEYADILTPAALQFVGSLAREFESRRVQLLQRRQDIQAQIDAGKFLNNEALLHKPKA